jgi:CubicO group peptidase (beta-lactamase class C family)
VGRRASVASALALAGLSLAAGACRAVEAQPAPAMRTYLSRLEGYGFSGAVLVTRDGETVVESYHGLADRKRGVPFGPETRFDVGSITKQFTATAILALEADGRLDTGDSIAAHLPDVPADKAAITILQLLTHTSGLPGDFGGDYEVVTRDELLRRALGCELRSPPGERHAYSNAGYSVLAAIVEQASGQPFDTYLRERLLRPAGMHDSGYDFSPAASARVARAYRDGRDLELTERAVATGGAAWNLIGNGGLLSTLRDMQRWMTALQGDALLPAAQREFLFRPQVLVSPDYKHSGAPLHYACGWYVWERPGDRMIWHLGGNGTWNAAVRWHVEHRTLVLYASNDADFHDPAYPVPAIERLLAGEVVELPPPVIALAPELLLSRAGHWTDGAGNVLVVEAEPPALRLRGEGQAAYSLVISGHWASDPAWGQLGERAAQAAEHARLGRHAELLAFYGPDSTLEGIAAFESAYWQKRQDALGPWMRTRVLGTSAPESRAFTGRTILRFDFERGSAWREMSWLPDGTIGDLGPLSEAPSRRFFPESPTSFLVFDAAAGRVLARLRFEGEGDDARLLVESDGEHVLRREPDGR